MGVIYIMTNPSFPDYVKIGYADDLESRLKQLNRSESIPYAFRAYPVAAERRQAARRIRHGHSPADFDSAMNPF